MRRLLGCHRTLGRLAAGCLASTLIASALLLAGCAREEMRKELDFRFALPTSWEVVQVARLDTDGDQENEWVILYSFDNPANKAFTPLRCAVYDIARREPKLPVIYPYHLQAPGWTYLGEGAGRVSVEIADIVTASKPGVSTPANEVIVKSAGGDGLVNRASIFRWRDNIRQDLRKRTDPHEVLIVPNQPEASGEWYECIGMFESTLEVRIQVDQVTVLDRANDRSQLARVNVYKPDSRLGGYLDEAQQLVHPVSSCIDFAYGMPEDLVQSPYPEKIVMAFHRQSMLEPDLGSNLLTPDARQRRASGRVWKYFDLGTWGPTTDICVKLVSYGPPEETEAEIQSFAQAEDQRVTDFEARSQPEIQTQSTIQAIPRKSPIEAQVETWTEYTAQGKQSQMVKVVWKLIREEEQGVWKIDDVREIQ